MSFSPLDSALYRALLSDAETAALLSDGSQVASMLAVEAALAEVQGNLGVIPETAARRIAEVAGSTEIAPESLADPTAKAGVPVPGLVAALRKAVGGEAAAFVHWGATSQDILDTATVLQLGQVLDLFDARLARLIALLAAQADAHRATVTLARTRSQQATPTSLGLKIATWMTPLARHRQRLTELRGRVLVLQFGGAAGNLSALDGRGLDVSAALAEKLGLPEPALPWHVQRDGMAELAGWFSLVSGSLGKLGSDLILLGQSEIGEVSAGAGGGSSTMPQKSNPVGAEMLVALARFNATLTGTVHQGLIHNQERDGAAWSLEWLSLPQMAGATGAALNHGLAIAENLEADTARISRTFENGKGLALAEAASFALAAHMPRPEAQKLVTDACSEVAGSGRHLLDVLTKRVSAPVDWQALRDPANHLGEADALIDRALAAVHWNKGTSDGR